MSDYKIQGETVTAFADQTRRLAAVEGGLTPPQMLELLGGLESTNTLTAAENSTFGIVEVESEFGILDWGNYYSGTNNGTLGYKFIPNEDITVSGIWARTQTSSSSAHSNCSYIWDENGNPVASVAGLLASTNGAVAYFDSPVILVAGKTYTVAARVNQRPQWYYEENLVVNPKITFVKSVMAYGSASSDPSATNFVDDNGWIIPTVDIVIAPSTAPVPDVYSVQLETMNDIANEVLRITGGNAKLKPEQIITALQGVAATT